MLSQTIHTSPAWRIPALFKISADAATPNDGKKRELIQIQWFVAIACSYLMIVQDGQVAQDALSLFLLSLPLGTMAVLLRLPEPAFHHRWFPGIMALVDAALFCTAIVYNRQSPWDLCLVFFSGILISAIGETLLQVIIWSLLAGGLSLLLLPSGNVQFIFDGNTVLRFPLMFGAALVYGHLSEQVKREKKNTARLEEVRRHQLTTKDKFISHVSHELRTPLTAIYQFVAILSDGLAGDLNQEQREYLAIVRRNVEQLQNMVGDLLEAARSADGKLAIEPRVLWLPELVSEVVSNHRASAVVKSIALSTDIPDTLSAVCADPQRVKQILGNLIGNAIKFTPEQGQITVSAQPLEADQGAVQVSVADTGCGIGPDAVPKIFDRLYQEEHMLDSNRNGLGLGLHICRELVTLQGGSIWAESQIGKGSTFHFTLPVFSLRPLLRPFLESLRSAELTLIAIEIDADYRVESSAIGKALWADKWNRLTKIALPMDALLLPRIMIAGQSERFFVVSAGDVVKARRLADRIETEIDGGRPTNGVQVVLKTTVLVADRPLPEDARKKDAVIEALSRQIYNVAGLRRRQSNTIAPPGGTHGPPFIPRLESLM